jgi:hypothetical protein
MEGLARRQARQREGGERMTTTVEESFDRSTYELEGTPRINGRNADFVTLAIAHEMDVPITTT